MAGSGWPQLQQQIPRCIADQAADVLWLLHALNMDRCGPPPTAGLDRDASADDDPSMQDAQQHDLSPAAASRVLREARLRAGETVVDVGAGLGALTHYALEAGAKVIALERDPQRVAHLRERFAAAIADGRVQLWEGDALLWHARMPMGWRVVANPPFNLTAPLINRWLAPGPGEPPAALDLVLQREAAQKLTPRAGPQTRTSIMVALAGRASIRMPLPRDATTPPARVDMCVWSFRREPGEATPAELVAVDRLLAKAFAGSHTMIDAVRGLATGIQVRRQALAHGWRPLGHPRLLQPNHWLAFAKLLILCHKL
jgi:16S rRNA A1518/A1519 N6-dimethyltransferase RsmA/KsgA/DIM1 with predicted DNA glycosylase/AP lyase activity